MEPCIDVSKNPVAFVIGIDNLNCYQRRYGYVGTIIPEDTALHHRGQHSASIQLSNAVIQVPVPGAAQFGSYLNIPFIGSSHWSPRPLPLVSRH
jgi:hypothetical protein